MKIYETLENGIKIVEYEPSLAAGIAEMWNLSQEDWGGSGILQTASQIITSHETSSNINVYIALDGDTVVGYCSFARFWADANTLYIPLLGVRTDYKNKKIGKALVLHCVQRTIEMGYPRLDLYTWSGNTAAVPLYKKCGFMWEDRPDTTHLANFIPTIITTPLFAEFFANADWYADAIRNMDITPDGVKVNKFELFEYRWEKDGHMLAVGFERTGRMMRLIETNDYKIELMAQDHELAAGIDYDCHFAITNKTGKELNVKITGKTEKNIRFDYNHETSVTGSITLDAHFHVGEITEPQDIWRVHPCLLADVEINGQAVTFGMGIESKFPLSANIYRPTIISQVGATVDAHINIESALLQNAELTLHMPQGNLIDIAGFPQTVSVDAKGKACIATTATVLGIGFEKLQLKCTATLQDGKQYDFTVPVEVFNQDLSHAFSGESKWAYRMFNGPWELSFEKSENWVGLLNNTYQNSGTTDFAPPQFGKPFDEEFNQLKPTVKMYPQGNLMVMEVEFVSEKFAGMVITQIYTMTAGGFVTRRNRIENRGNAPQHVMLCDRYSFNLGVSTVFSRNGLITQNHDAAAPDGCIYGCSNSDGMDENWIFEASPIMPRGFCWAAEYKPHMQWGQWAYFEIDPGEMAPNAHFETKPVVCALGIFQNYENFRDYARQIYTHNAPIPAASVEIVLNGYNPFVSTAATKLDVLYNRDVARAGTVCVSSNVFDTTSQTNSADESIAFNKFELPLTGSQGIEIANIAMHMDDYEKTHRRAMFFPAGETTCVQDGNIFTVQNGEITFKVDPVYSHGCYSLTDAKGQEWLITTYPNHEPFSWWNPFLGGIKLRWPNMDNKSVLQEKITAEFAEKRDNFGNLWKGICTTVNVTENDTYKGAQFKTYFMTLPGLPVLCTFFQVINGMGAYFSNSMDTGVYLNPCESAADIYVEVTDKYRRNYRMHMGIADSAEIAFENTAVVTSKREEILYVFHGNRHNGKVNEVWGNNKLPALFLAYMEARAAHGETFTSSPMFLTITDKELPTDALVDLERVKFE